MAALYILRTVPVFGFRVRGFEKDSFDLRGRGTVGLGGGIGAEAGLIGDSTSGVQLTHVLGRIT